MVVFCVKHFAEQALVLMLRDRDSVMCAHANATCRTEDCGHSLTAEAVPVSTSMDELTSMHASTLPMA